MTKKEQHSLSRYLRVKNSRNYRQRARVIKDKIVRDTSLIQEKDYEIECLSCEVNSLRKQLADLEYLEAWNTEREQ